MNVKELNADELRYIKQQYMVELSNENKLAETLGCDVSDPSYEMMAFPDVYVGDDEVLEYYSDVQFVENDFWR